MKKILVFISLIALGTSSVGAYTELDCKSDSIDPVFNEHSCNQCFEGENKKQGDFLGLLSDLWRNAGENDKIVFKEIQVDPEMINLAPSQVNWTMTPDDENFWEYTDEFNALYDDVYEGYVLGAGEQVNWIESSLSHAYKLDTNTADTGANIGLLVYPITTHNILSDGEITIDNAEHRECVLFKSGEAATEEPVERLPETGPAEFALLILLAAILGFGVLRFRART